MREHGEEYQPEAYKMVQEWLDSIAEKRLQDPEGSEERKEAFKRARAGAVQMQEVAPARRQPRAAAGAARAPVQPVRCRRGAR